SKSLLSSLTDQIKQDTLLRLPLRTHTTSREPPTVDAGRAYAASSRSTGYHRPHETSESKGNMSSKAPKWDSETLTGIKGVIHTDQPVQTGCVMCLSEGLEAPAEDHVTYMYQGTSYCGKHLSPFVVKAATSE